MRDFLGTFALAVLLGARAVVLAAVGRQMRQGGMCECGHPVIDHVGSNWGPHSVCVEHVEGGWHGVCPCVRREARDYSGDRDGVPVVPGGRLYPVGDLAWFRALVENYLRRFGGRS